VVKDGPTMECTTRRVAMESLYEVLRSLGYRPIKTEGRTSKQAFKGPWASSRETTARNTRNHHFHGDWKRQYFNKSVSI